MGVSWPSRPMRWASQSASASGHSFVGDDLDLLQGEAGDGALLDRIARGSRRTGSLKPAAMPAATLSSDRSPRRSSQASRASASSRGGGGIARRGHHAIGDRLHEQVAPGGVIVGIGGGLVDVEQDLGLGLGHGHVAVAAIAVDDAAQQIDVGLGDDAGLEQLARAQRAGAVDHRVLDLLEGEARQGSAAPSAPCRAR